MTKKEKAAEIQKILEELYPDPPIPLHHKDAYTLLVSVVLSAQCTDDRVNIITEDLYDVADNPADMVALGIDEIKEYIKSCGLANNKSKALYNLSRIILEKHGGKVPDNYKDLEALPGVGHKTASVVMSQAFGEPAFPVDTHIHRLAYRWALSTGKDVVKTEHDLKRIFPKETWNVLHLQIIYFGREYCSARGHKAEECPICSKFGRKGI